MAAATTATVSSIQRLLVTAFFFNTGHDAPHHACAVSAGASTLTPAVFALLHVPTAFEPWAFVCWRLASTLAHVSGPKRPLVS
jgi:hypothetical protein